MRTNNAHAVIETYRRNYSPKPGAFLKRLAGYFAVFLVITLYGHPETALEVLIVLLLLDLFISWVLGGTVSKEDGGHK
ncbi:hypothetical protein [Thermococcus aciditolerans]|uniref:Uncharacterized protein n=1 Tax=Thermococcus aciditolerans TaxID=2598455 RepID=A0A5C0SI32_9EURY|nr:hypothetical protein [Thermococcus aciditolerans]QEK14113.1 hypothetical protein FPV09_02150 [Thermococcus aciditolerans]